MVSPLGSAISTIVQWRDAFAQAAAILQPIFDAEAAAAAAPAIAELTAPASRRKALPAGRNGKTPDKPASKPRAGGTDPKVIARIRELAGKGLSVNAIAEKTGVSYPTAKKYAEGHRPAAEDEEESDDEEDDAQEPAQVRRPARFQEIAPRRCGQCQQMSTSNPCANCQAPL